MLNSNLIVAAILSCSLADSPCTSSNSFIILRKHYDMIDAAVLVIDVDDDILLSAKLLLKQHFRQVTTCKSPKEINVLLGRTETDIILLDMN